MYVVSEPGYYEDGGFGIRIENVMVVKVAEVGSGFLQFDPITWVRNQNLNLNLNLNKNLHLTWSKEVGEGHGGADVMLCTLTCRMPCHQKDNPIFSSLGLPGRGVLMACAARNRMRHTYETLASIRDTRHFTLRMLVNAIQRGRVRSSRGQVGWGGWVGWGGRGAGAYPSEAHGSGSS